MLERNATIDGKKQAPPGETVKRQAKQKYFNNECLSLFPVPLHLKFRKIFSA
jgi:hypothetical protein